MTDETIPLPPDPANVAAALPTKEPAPRDGADV